MRNILFLTFLLFELTYAKSLVVSAQSEFVPFLKNLEKSRKGLNFIIRDKNSSLDAFNDLKSAVATVAIVRGDILADNIEGKNFFRKSSFTDFKVITKLKENFSSFLYLISKDGENNAYTLLNPDPKIKKMKKISIGYLNDLSNIYLEDIAKSVNSNYRFRYKSFSPEQSLNKLKEGSIDAAYIFISKKFKQKVRKEGLKLTNIVKPANVKAEDFAKKLSEQKAFNKIGNKIRVDNYLVAYDISDEELSSLVGSLKQNNELITNIKPEVGAINPKITAISTQIDIQKGEAIAEAKQKAKECKETSTKSKEIAEKQASFKTYEKNVLKSIKKILFDIEKSPDLASFRPRIENDLLVSVKDSSREAKRLLSNVRDSRKECDTANITSSLVELSSKIDEIKGIRKELAILQSDIIKKRQMDEELTIKEEKAQEEELAREDRLLQAQLQIQLEQESRAIEAELAKEERAKNIELEKMRKDAEEGIFTKVKKAIFD